MLLRGVAAGAEGAGAEVSLAFDGARISACVKPGTSALATVALLEKALPEGYRLSMCEEIPGEVVLEVIRSPNAPAPRVLARDEDASPFGTDAFVG